MHPPSRTATGAQLQSLPGWYVFERTAIGADTRNWDKTDID